MSPPNQDAQEGRPDSPPRRWSTFAAACSASRAPVTPPVTDGWCAKSSSWQQPRPYGGYFDDIVDRLAEALRHERVEFEDAVEKVVVYRDELTLHVRRDLLPRVAQRLRDEPELRFELCLGVSGVHYPHETGRELHAVYPLQSITHNRRLRLEVSAPDSDPHIPSLFAIYPTNDWHERETYDFFGIIFDGHPALTRIEMPDDWQGHPQRKDYPLGGIPVEYKGAQIPPPDERRGYN